MRGFLYLDSAILDRVVRVSKASFVRNLFLYIGSIPIKNRLDNVWVAKEVRITDAMLLDKDLFPEVQWSDEEPTKVKLEIVK